MKKALVEAGGVPVGRILARISLTGAIAAALWAAWIAVFSPAVCRGGADALMCSTGGLVLIAAPFVLTGVGGATLAVVMRDRSPHFGGVALVVQLAGACFGVYLSSL